MRMTYKSGGGRKRCGGNDRCGGSQRCSGSQRCGGKRAGRAAVLLAAALAFGGFSAPADAATAASAIAAAPAAAATPAASAIAAAPAGAQLKAGRPTAAARTFEGARDYNDVLFNSDFQDISGSWARGAIYECAALGIIKGYGSSVFGGAIIMTKAQALALALRAAGLEGAAQIAGEALEAAARKAGAPPSSADVVWAGGYLKTAADMGLISADDYGAAMGYAASQAVSAFRAGLPAQRQEFAYWLARALGIPPARRQEALFTKYIDWRDVDSLYVPHIEAILSEKIMNGDSFGRLSPRAAVTREQAAQIIKNASKYVYAKNGFAESTGTIEKIETDSASAPEGANAEITRAFYYIRAQTGRQDVIVTRIADSDAAGAASAARRETGLAVYGAAGPEDETALRAGDRIRYISSKNRTPGKPDEIRYIEILERSGGSRHYVLAQIDGIDAANRRMAFTQIFPLESSDPGELRRAAEAPQALLRPSADYIYSEDVAVQSEGKRIGVGDLAAGMTVIIGIENFNNLFYIETSGFGHSLGIPGIARGVIEENNPALGYIAMYSESGDRTNIKSLGNENEMPELMIYSYDNPAAVDVTKDGFAAAISDLCAGDSAYVSVDGTGALAAVCAVTNYKRFYGTVVSVAGDTVILRPENGAGVIAANGAGNVKANADAGGAFSFALHRDVLYFMNYRLVGKSALTPGSLVRILLRDMGGAAAVREITIMKEGDRGLIGGVYKAELSRFDEMSKKAVIYNVQKLVKGRWERTDRKGVDTIDIDAETRVYVSGAAVTIAQADKLLRGAEIFIAAKNGYGGVEIAAQINVNGPDNKELLFDDTVRAVRHPSGAFDLTKGPDNIIFGGWTIVVKDGKLVSGAAIGQDDLAYVVAGREDSTGRLRAEVVEIGDRAAANYKLHIYMGRVAKVTANKEFTLESFSEFDLSGTEWRYANTPKTFNITFETLLLDADGRAPIDRFDSRGAYDYTDPPRSVYVLSDGVNALAVSAAPFGAENVRGRVLSADGKIIDEYWKDLSGPERLTLTGVSVYDRAKNAWSAKKSDAVIALRPDTLIVKEGAAAAPAALKPSDSVRVIKSGAGASGEAYIIIVE